MSWYPSPDNSNPSPDLTTGDSGSRARTSQTRCHHRHPPPAHPVIPILGPYNVRGPISDIRATNERVTLLRCVSHNTRKQCLIFYRRSTSSFFSTSTLVLQLCPSVLHGSRPGCPHSHLWGQGQGLTTLSPHTHVNLYALRHTHGPRSITQVTPCKERSLVYEC